MTPITTMRAVVQRAYGSADTWSIEEIERPTPSDQQVLVKVDAAGLDRGTWHLMTGEPRLVRLVMGLRRPKNPVPGSDVAGTVVEVGAGVTRFAVGDRVFGGGHGSFAEYTVAHEGSLAHMPASCTAEQAAAVPVSGCTAWEAVHTIGKVQPGQSVVVVGASGGVGSFAVQIAKAAGATVTGVCSPGKASLVRALGADDVIDHTTTDFADGTRTWDLVVDNGGNTPIRHLRRALTPKGTAVLVGSENGGKWLGPLGRSLRGAAWSPFIGQRIVMFVAKLRAAELEQMAALMDAGTMLASVDSVYPLEQAADAMRHLESGAVRGKVVVTP